MTITDPDRPNVPSDATLAAWAEEVRLYRLARLARLTAETGWLTLVNKVWLSDGASTLGAARESDVALPADRAPAHVATIVRRGTEVRLEPAPGAEILARGARVTAPLILRSDAEPPPDELRVGTLRLELIRRGDDFAIRVRDPESPLRRNFPGIPCFPFDPAWRIEARIEPHPAPRTIMLADNDGRPQANVCPGVAVFDKDGVPCRLDLLFEDASRRRFFLLFGDLTNRTGETYGAGRFLYAPLPPGGAAELTDARVVLDFNKAFNPPCVFSPFTACPLPSRDNRLAVRVAAGEKLPAAHAS